VQKIIRNNGILLLSFSFDYFEGNQYDYVDGQGRETNDSKAPRRLGKYLSILEGVEDLFREKRW
jgi:hypothetical protein